MSGLQEASDSGGFDDGDMIELSQDMKLPSDTVGLEIDAALDPAVWNGTTFEDRAVHSVSTAARDLVTQMERSLMQQENYAEFSQRMTKQMGIVDTSAKGVLRDWINQLSTEASVAWNTSMVSANQGDDTVLVSEAILDESTTEECWDAHGVLEGEAPAIPRHFKCRCQWRTISNPESDDPEVAAEGQAILAEMAAERGAG